MTDQKDEVVVATREMCCACFDAIIGYLNDEKPRKLKNPSFPNRCFPLFVTWNKYSSSSDEYHLRGCIGTFAQDVPLYEALPDYAITSAFEDRRFNPISQSELSRLKCSVSLLINFEEAKDVYDWTIGVHGIRITFPIELQSKFPRMLSGTYLPEVCPEQNWTKEECLASLYRKVGHRETVTKELMRNTKLVRYKSSKAHLTFEEYQSMSAANTNPDIYYQSCSSNDEESDTEDS